MKSLAQITPTKLLAAKKDRDELNKLLNVTPKKAWLKKHPTLGHEYIPIEIIENLLTTIFQDWSVEVKDIKQLFNSVSVTVRLHYRDPIDGIMRFHDGVGAAPMQVDKGQAASNMQAIKSNAVQMGLPAAKSYAIKDAVEHIGKLFGRDVNRKDSVELKTQYSSSDEEYRRAAAAIDRAISKTELNNIWKAISDTADADLITKLQSNYNLKYQAL